MLVVLLSIAADGGPSESYDEFRTFQLSRDKSTDSFVFSILVSKFKRRTNQSLRNGLKLCLWSWIFKLG